MKWADRGDRGRIPLATYRMGFHKGFRLSQALRLVPYLERLGITTLYASPLFASRSGSSHGYDVTDPTRLNPEIGNRTDFERLGRSLDERGMGMILDIVPNHMAAHFENPWWRDLLENGESSRFSMFFDVDWDPPQRALEHRISLPILGGPYQRVLENRELELVFRKEGFAIRYWDTLLPVDPGTLRRLLEDMREHLDEIRQPETAQARDSLDAITEEIARLSSRSPSRLTRRLRSRSGERIHKALRTLWRKSLPFREALEKTLVEYNGIRGIPSSFDRLDSLLDGQVYWLSHWKTVTRTLNYRRFFDVADLVGVRMEDERVFEAFHHQLLEWVSKGLVTGVRVDHVDGLRDPSEYLGRLVRHLREAMPQGTPQVWVEKILASDELLPGDWPVMGTTGYEFMNRLTAVSGDPEGVRAIRRWYETRISPGASFDDIVYHLKKYVAETLLGGELRRLTLMLEWLAQNGRTARELPFRDLQGGIVEISACLAVYRTYMRGDTLSQTDRSRIMQVLSEARRRHRVRRHGLYRFFERILTLDIPPDAPADRKSRWTDFVAGWQQFTGPVMAKGVEDTAFYRYSPLISFNEVGGDPRCESLDTTSFHAFNARRLDTHPLTLSATSTHDTKRSEDVRARIQVLSEYGEEWIARVEQWMHWNRAVKTSGTGGPIPDPALEQFLYQTLVGAWPLEAKEEAVFLERMSAYAVKVAREAKVHSNWITPDTVYEDALTRFLRGVFGKRRKASFREDFARFSAEVAREGAALSLGWLVLKMASPGVCDFYQGTELWDLSLVDPDNRRPVDYARRERFLSDILVGRSEDPGGIFPRLLDNWADGRVKMFVMLSVLEERRRHPDLFLEGSYRPLDPVWEEEEQMTGFVRSLPGRDVLAVVSRRVRGRLAPGSLRVRDGRFSGKIVPLPEGTDPGGWRHLLTGNPVRPVVRGGPSLGMEEVMAGAPVSVLVREKTLSEGNKR